jgi:hypothetical protein
MGKIVGNYRYDDKFTCTSTATKTFVGPEVGRGKIVEITFASVVDYTTAGNILALGIRDAQGGDHYLLADVGAALYRLAIEGKFYLLPGEKPIAIVDTPGATDVVFCSFHGIVYEEG